MSPAQNPWLKRYLAVRRPAEALVWVLFFAVQAVANTVTVGMDLTRRSIRFERWQVASWELSSNAVWLALVPLLLWLLDRWPLRWGLLCRHLPRHALAALACSGLHVLGMVALRKLIYAAHGQHYDFGNWPTELFYEALKDVRTYALIAALALAYRLLLWRWQGEAGWLAAPDEATAPAVTAVPSTTAAEAPDRPERLLVRKLGKEFLIPTAEVEWVQACGNYVNLHRQQHDYPLRSTLAGIEKRLDPALFVRVHRGYLVNLALVEAIEPTEAGDARVRMKDGSSVPCSRTHLEGLRQRAA